MGDKVLHAPFDPQAISTAIDVGCGTGIVTDRIARQLPSAKVYGIDLSNVPEATTPRPSNVSFVKGNFRELCKNGVEHTSASDEKNEPKFLSESSVDYAFSRLLWPGMTDWPGYVADVYRTLRPGAWFEVHESHLILYKNGQAIPTKPDGVYSRFRRELRKKGMDMDIAVHVGGYFHAAGFEDVRMFEYKLPMGEQDPRMPGDKEWPALARETFGDSFASLKAVAFKDQVLSKQENEDIELERRGWAEEEKGKHFKFYVIIGRKPLS